MNKKENIIKFFKFALVGFSNTLVNYLVFLLIFKVFGIFYMFASAIGYITAVFNSYFWNLRWTFKSKHSVNVFGKFVIVNIASLSLNLLIMRTLVEAMLIDELISQIFAIIGALIINFSGNNLWTFKK